MRDADTGAEKHTFEHGRLVYSVAFSPDGRLAAGDYANKLIVRDADTGAEKHAFEHGGFVFSVAFSPDGKWFAAGDNAKKLTCAAASFGMAATMLADSANGILPPRGARSRQDPRTTLTAAGARQRNYREALATSGPGTC